MALLANFKGLKRFIAHGPLPIYFLITLFVIQIFGMMMQFSASYTVAFFEQENSYFYIEKHLQITFLGLFLMFLVSRFDYHYLYGLSILGYVSSIAGMLVILIFCEPLNEARRWVNFPSGPLSKIPAFQFSEAVKFAVILFSAYFICRHHRKGKSSWAAIITPIFWLIPVVVIMILQPHYSGAIIMCAIVVTMIVLTGTGGWRLLAIGGVGVTALPVVYVLLMQIESIAERVNSRLDGWTLDVTKMEWQNQQSIYAIGSGGLKGLGLGNGIQKQMWLPEATNDCIFSVVCEELGFIGAFVVVVLFVVFIIEGLYIAYRAADLFGALLAYGIVAQFGWQFLFNIGVVTSLLPNTGISLPFFSSGGTSLLFLLLEIGVLLSISRIGTAARKAREAEENEELTASVTAEKSATLAKPKTAEKSATLTKPQKPEKSVKSLKSATAAKAVKTVTKQRRKES